VTAAAGNSAGTTNASLLHVQITGISQTSGTLIGYSGRVLAVAGLLDRYCLPGSMP
jgi:hypothetical protein